MRNKSVWIGAWVGGIISLLPIPIFFISFYLDRTLASIIRDIGWLPTTIPTALFTGKILASQYHGEEGMAFFVLFPLSILLNIIIGALIGLVIYKIKSKTK